MHKTRLERIKDYYNPNNYFSGTRWFLFDLEPPHKIILELVGELEKAYKELERYKGSRGIIY